MKERSPLSRMLDVEPAIIHAESLAALLDLVANSIEDDFTEVHRVAIVCASDLIVEQIGAIREAWTAAYEAQCAAAGLVDDGNGTVEETP